MTTTKTRRPSVVPERLAGSRGCAPSLPAAGSQPNRLRSTLSIAQVMTSVNTEGGERRNRTGCTGCIDHFSGDCHHQTATLPALL